MNSGEIVAMSEPSSIVGAVKLVSASAVSGIGASVALIQANPEIAAAAAPSLEKSLYLLVCGIVLAAGKAYMPSEKKVDSQFEAVKAKVDTVHAGHQSLLDRLENVAFESRADAAERRDHYASLNRWMGGVDEKLSSMSGNLEDVTGRLVRIERSQRDSGEIRRPTQ